MKARLYQQVALTQDLPEYQLKHGDVALVIGYLTVSPEPTGELGYKIGGV